MNENYVSEVDGFIDDFNVMVALSKLNKGNEFLDGVIEGWAKYTIDNFIKKNLIVVLFNQFDYDVEDIHFIINETNEEILVDDNGYLVENYEQVVH